MEKIFVIQFCRMGDLVQTLPLLQRLKQAKQQCHITLLCVRESMQIIERTPLVDRFICLPYRDYQKIMQMVELDAATVKFLWDLPGMREAYDLVINLTHDTSSAEICARLQGRQRTGRSTASQDEIRALGDWAKYFFACVRNRTQNLFNIVDIHVGMGAVPHQPVQSWLNPDTVELARGDELLASHGRRASGPLVAFQMGASERHRAWPVEQFAELARQLTRRPDLEIVLVGSPGEKSLGEEFAACGSFPVINLIGNTQMTDLPAILKRCALLVSNDTGTAHIAAAVGTRVLGLYFSTAYFGETAPYGPDHITLQVELPCSPCLNKDRCSTIECKEFLTVEAVGQVANSMLGDRREASFDFPNLIAYRSRFLANGTLVYAPLSPTISDQYQIGFINRLLWEAAFHLEHDSHYLAQYLPLIRQHAGFQSLIENYKHEFSILRDQYRNGLRLAHEIILEFSNRPIDTSKVRSANDQLLAIQTSIMNMTPSMIHHYHQFEMMDMDYAAHPELAHSIVAKYSKLYGMVNRFMNKLDEISTSNK